MTKPPASGNGDPSTTPAGTTDPVDPGNMQEPPPAVDVMGGRIYWLDIAGNGVYTAKPDGSGKMKIATALAAPDGIAADECSGRIYFSNMGSVLGNSGQASVQSASWDGSDLKTLVKPGSGVNTAKQLTLDLLHGHVYFADREGAKVWRMNLDGSELMPVVSGHDFAQLVGVAVDSKAGDLYFGDRNNPRLFRTKLELPAGKTADNRDDIETLVKSPSSAMPIDLALDLRARQLYWTDRELGTVKRIGLDMPAGDDPANRSDEETIIDGLNIPIGISLDVTDGKLYVTEAGGAVFRAAVDGSANQMIAKTSSGTGIAYALIGPSGEHLTCE
jgi:sugar lactone lactonase YvrE